MLLKLKEIGIGIVFFFLFAWPVLAGQKPLQVKIGFFEGGEYPQHEVLRDAFRNELKSILPKEYELVSIPQAYKTAGWNRQKCREMAEELAGLEELDIVVTCGPWVVEDLLQAGFTKPIIAMYRFDPEAEGLVDSTSYPIADNLTVRLRPEKFESDLATFINLRKFNKLGVLFFPSGNEQEKVMSRFKKIGEQLGFETVTAEGYNNVGCYAFFKTYGILKEQGVKALYISPLWGFDLVKINWFFKEAARDHILVFTSEGRFIVQRGALASDVIHDISGVARYHAYKAKRIILGELPADLPVVFPEALGLSINEELARKYHVVVPDEAVTGIEVIPAPSSEETPTMNLSQAIEIAFQANPGYLAAYSSMEAAAQEAGQAYSEYLPHLSAIGSAGYVDDNTVDNYRDEIKNNHYGLSIALEQQIFSMAAIRSIQLAAKKKEQREISLQEAGLDLEMAVIEAYLNYLKAREIVEIYLEKKKYVEYNLEISQTDVYLGDTGNVDVYRWRDEYLKVIREINESKKNIKIARVLFNLLLSQPGHTPIELDSALMTEEQWQTELVRLQPYIFERQKALQTEDFLVTNALSGSPAMTIRSNEIDLQKIRLAKNKSRYYPTLGFTASFDIRDSLADFSPVFKEKNNTWSVGAKLTLPLFSGTDRLKERRVLKARLNELEYLKDNDRLEIIARVRTLMFETINLLNRVTDDVEANKQARAYADMMMRRYSAGDVSLIEVCDAIDNAALVRLRGITDRYGYFDNTAKLLRQIGWSVRDSKRTPGMELLFRIYQHLQTDGDKN